MIFKKISDELAKVGIVKETKASGDTAAPKVGKPTMPQTLTQEGSLVTTLSPLPSDGGATEQSSTDQSDTGAGAAAAASVMAPSQSEVNVQDFKSEEPMRRDVMQLVDAMVMMYSISTHKVMQDPFAMQLLIKEYEGNITNTKEKLKKCPESVSKW